jgi:hypothetical protein
VEMESSPFDNALDTDCRCHFPPPNPAGWVQIIYPGGWAGEILAN